MAGKWSCDLRCITDWLEARGRQESTWKAKLCQFGLINLHSSSIRWLQIQSFFNSSIRLLHCNRIMAEAVKGRLGQELQELSQLIEEVTTPYTEKE